MGMISMKNKFVSIGRIRSDTDLILPSYLFVENGITMQLHEIVVYFTLCLLYQSKFNNSLVRSYIGFFFFFQLKFFVSGADREGEGESKIFEHMRHMSAASANENVCNLAKGDKCLVVGK